jgi:DNA-binding XRE family transcriptional regulator
MISPTQIKAARALLDWKQSTLAERAGVTQVTVANIEVGKHAASRSTLVSIMRVFQSEGIEFMTDGVRKLPGIRDFVGPEACERVIEDAYYLLRETGGELLIGGADESQNRPGVESAIRKLRRAGIKMRALVDERSTHLLAPLDEYRSVPSKYFINNPTFIYGDRVAVAVPRESEDFIQVIVNSNLASAQRLLFNFLWDHCRQPLHSTAQQIYA